MQFDNGNPLCYNTNMSTIYLSETANPLLIEYLKQQGHIISIIEMSDITYPPVSSHPDIYMCSMGPGRPVYFGCSEKIGSKYPDNIIYNAACTGRFFIHTLKYTDPELIKILPETLECIDVPQGYTKCNTLIVDENSIITSDIGIYNLCYGKLDVLLIEKGHIKLQGFDYGFIGGASGRVGSAIIFNGDVTLHPDYEKIAAFIEDRDLKIKYFTEYPLEDIGSIIEEP